MEKTKPGPEPVFILTCLKIMRHSSEIVVYLNFVVSYLIDALKSLSLTIAQFVSINSSVGHFVTLKACNMK